RPLARPALEAGRPRWRVNIGGRVCRLKPGKGGRDGREGDLLVGFAVSLPRPEARDGAPSHGPGRGAVPPAPPPPRPPAVRPAACGGGLYRSEEHTSELQSRENLVCRLLLEKKNRLDT